MEHLGNIAKNTLNALESSDELRHFVRKSIESTVILNAAPVDSDRAVERLNTCYEVTREKSTEAVFRMSTPGKRTAVLNFASGHNPGGGFLRDAKAQEEDLCRTSGLYQVLSSYAAAPYYELGSVSKPFYVNSLVYSPSVPFFRTSDLVHRETVLADVITCAAPNLSGIGSHTYSQNQIDAALRERIELILRAPITFGATQLVLGAWGCGVFRNDASAVAKEFLRQLTSQFSGCYDRVCFAVWTPQHNTTNYDVFKDVFSTLESL